MKGEISDKGYLEIEGEKKFCPFQYKAIECGIWCPLFSEPTKPKDNFMVRLNICFNNQFYFKEFKDNRRK